MRRAPVNPPGDGIARVPAAPTCLRFLPAGSLTFRRVTGPLSDSYSRIRPEPPAADSAWSLPSLWHRDDSSSSSRKDSRRWVRSECLRHFWRVRTGHFWGRRSHHPFRAYRAGARWCKEARRDAGLLVRALVRAANWKVGAIGNVSRRRQISKPRLDMCPVRLGSLGAECGNTVCIRSKQALAPNLLVLEARYLDG